MCDRATGSQELVARYENMVGRRIPLAAWMLLLLFAGRGRVKPLATGDVRGKRCSQQMTCPRWQNINTGGIND